MAGAFPFSLAERRCVGVALAVINGRCEEAARGGR